ncbi:hypothetical protein E1A91_D03G012100v1 [Gossypium mustelinum]|uniref:3-epi-6-deoxocathasterone 23-monooxygenase n=1 Tax=Gossypium mustelinum TaxID=34275 RepID=A0A5D2VHE9_GOSMU|nr:hypothetical protein E1A91_D03G012100v1 [Gossypium mustelinum]
MALYIVKSEGFESKEDMGLLIIIISLMGVVWFWYKMKKMMRKEDRGTNKSGGSGGGGGGVVPKGNLGWPFIGETLHFIASGYSSQPVSFMDKRKLLHGKVFKTHLLGTPIIVSTDPDVNKVVLQNHGNTFIPAYPKSITELLGEHSILQMNGNLQKRLHALIAGFLRSPQFKTRITAHIESSVVSTLGSWQHMQVLLVQEETKKITFEVLVKVLMSVGPCEDLEFLRREFEEFIKGLICLPIKLPGTRLYKSLKAKERLLKVVKKIVEERKLAMEEETDEKGMAKDAVDVLLRDSSEEPSSDQIKQSLPLDFISGNIIEMMIPGEETVPMAMTLAVKFLSGCPVAQQQLMVISETLRMANIINGVWRKALKDIDIKGYLIPKGWCVLTSFISVHMDEENYRNPYLFEPWRWEKIGAAANNNSFTPFGGGQRLCPGLELSRLEISIFLHHLVTTYRWVAQEDEIIYFPTVKMKKKLPIKVTPLCNYQ